MDLFDKSKKNKAENETPIESSAVQDPRYVPSVEGPGRGEINGVVITDENSPEIDADLLARTKPPTERCPICGMYKLPHEGEYPSQGAPINPMHDCMGLGCIPTEAEARKIYYDEMIGKA